MPSNIVETKKAPVKFVRRANDMYLKRHLPRKALAALEVLGKICARFDELLQTDNNPLIKNRRFLIEVTCDEALKAFNGEGENRWAYLPHVFQHLLVMIGKDFKQSVSAVQQFTNNDKFMQMLDDAWRTPPEEPKAENVSETVQEPVKETVAEQITNAAIAIGNIPWQVMRNMRNKVSISRGTQLQIAATFNRQGENWIKLTSGIEIPAFYVKAA